MSTRVETDAKSAFFGPRAEPVGEKSRADQAKTAVVRRSQACNTPGVDVEPQDLGPISPELALVDPVLAERARELLPDRRYEPAAASPPRPRVETPAVGVPRTRTRRWRRTAVLAVLIFVAGAASGGILGGRDVQDELGLRPDRDVGRTTSDQLEQTLTPRTAATGWPPPGPAGPRARARRVELASQRSANARWAANVLGVAADLGGRGVKLTWQRPDDSDHVVVLRAVGARKKGQVVFRGGATAFRDDSARVCSAYRYVIVNYDRRGHRSTGVTTSVVTPGCT